jgi:hypothetical protein
MHPRVTIGLAVCCKRVGEASDLGSTTVEVPKPFVKEVSNEGKPSQRPWFRARGVFVPSFWPAVLSVLGLAFKGKSGVGICADLSNSRQ